MATVSETIPDELEADVAAALDWFNREQPVRFEVTGILDPEVALATDSPRELQLVLCGGDRCEQRSFRVADGRVAFVEDERERAEAAARPAELDPPPGARRGWLDRTIAEHAFTVVLFYRGFW